MRSTKKLFGFLLIITLFLIPQLSKAAEDLTCGVYFTGVGCPHCAKADPIILKDALQNNNNLVVIEYEIYQQRSNAYLLSQYNDNYQSGLGIPNFIFNKNKTLVGDRDIKNNFETAVDNYSGNNCPLVDGQEETFSELDLNSLPGRPKIWRGERILFKKGATETTEIKKLITAENFKEALKDFDFNKTEPQKVALSGQSVEFDQAVQIGNWVFQWRGASLEGSGSGEGVSSNPEESSGSEKVSHLTWAKVLSLAAVDAVNPCALAVLLLMLTAILSYNPDGRKKLLKAGLAFVGAVFIMYLFYGLVIIKMFHFIQALTTVRLWLYKGLGILAIILGILNMWDFWNYSSGTPGTEMPLFLRPKVKKLISKVTSPKGAFMVGLFVTLFLLPCTIGPYIITGGILSGFSLGLNIIPLVVYNLVFVLPMLIVVGLVYYSFRNIEDVKEWKNKHICKLHLVAGAIMFLLGLAMVFGWL